MDVGKKKEKFIGAIELLSKLVKNIIDNQTEDKYRTFKRVRLSS